MKEIGELIIDAIDNDLSPDDQIFTYRRIAQNYLTSTLTLTDNAHINSILRISFEHTKLCASPEKIKKELTNTNTNDNGEDSLVSSFDFASKEEAIIDNLVDLTGYTNRLHVFNLIHKKLLAEGFKEDTILHVIDNCSSDIGTAIDNCDCFGESRAVAIAIGVIRKQYNQFSVVSSSSKGNEVKPTNTKSVDVQKVEDWLCSKYRISIDDKSVIWDYINNLHIKSAKWLEWMNSPVAESIITGNDGIAELRALMQYFTSPVEEYEIEQTETEE